MSLILLAIILSILGVSLEVLFNYIIFIDLEKIFLIFQLGLKLLSVLIVLFLIKNRKTLSKEIPWIIFIMLFPITGTISYLIFASDLIKSNLLKKIAGCSKEAKDNYHQDPKILEELQPNNIVNYISNVGNYPITKNNQVIYYSTGESLYESLLKELKQADQFILIEFFTIALGTMWDQILEILKEKAQSGVEIKIIYDATACLKKLPPKYFKKLASFGIACEPYFKNSSLIGIIKNHREHRKVVIIDGKIAFTGGINIGDEYINLKNPYGVWKDMGLSIAGEAVWNFTVMFLKMWEGITQEEIDFQKYHKTKGKEKNIKGYVIPFGDNPLDQDNIGKNTYLNLINQAHHTIYITTPYLILDTDLYNALVLAQKRGVEVHIMIPGIPDKKIVYQVTTSYAKALVQEQIKVYTYTKGFLHGKVLLVDDTIALVGTMNMDYRSFYWDFEYGVFLQEVPALSQIKKDMHEIIDTSKQLTQKDVKTNILLTIWESLLRLIAPLM